MPDITLLFPLAHCFGVSIDDLMGYDAQKAEKEINALLEEYSRLLREGKHAEAGECISRGIAEYHGDARIMNAVAWHIAGGYADNDPEVLIENREELWGITERILDTCTDDLIRLDARNLQAKIYHAEGKTEKAIEIYDSYFSDWYQTGEQKKEQLFAKDTPEFQRLLLLNEYELIGFYASKKSKELWYCLDEDVTAKGEKALSIVNTLYEAAHKPGCEEYSIAAYIIAYDIEHKMSLVSPVKNDIIKALTELKERSAACFNSFAENEPTVREFIQKRFGRDEI